MTGFFVVLVLSILCPFIPFSSVVGVSVVSS